MPGQKGLLHCDTHLHRGRERGGGGEGGRGEKRGE